MIYPWLFAALLAAASACSQEPSGGNADQRPADGMPMMSDGGPGMMDGRMMGGMVNGGMDDMRTIHGLLGNHESIERRVEDIPGGVRTVTVSDDPEVASLIRAHVREMKARYERDQPIRPMDPVFRELFRHRDKARMGIEDIPGGVRVTHTSDYPQVTLLIRQHARRFVSEAADKGMSRAMRPTPLPKGYARPAE